MPTTFMDGSLQENVKLLCEEFLEYILKNHQISQGPKGILHAFNIALVREKYPLFCFDFINVCC
jgi:hypothetical protein